MDLEQRKEVRIMLSIDEEKSRLLDGLRQMPPEWNIEFLYMLRGMAMISSFGPKPSTERRRQNGAA